MSINPYILLGIGAAFAVAYAATITFGWALTRRNRRTLREGVALSRVPTMVLDGSITDAPKSAIIVSLQHNVFKSSKGEAINVNDYKQYVAVGTSKIYPEVESGDLMLFDRNNNLKYVFKLPDINKYR